jgi:polyisoprenoid-binding protein YceI
MELQRILFATLAFSIVMADVAAAGPITQDPAKVPKGDYVLDKRHSSLVVKIPHLGGFSRFTARFNGLDGGFSYDPATWANTKVTINVDPKSISTNVEGFDAEIATKYFEAAKYPTITFVTTAAAGQNGRGTVTGDLTFKGVTKPVTLDVAFNGFGPGLPIPGNGPKMGFSGIGRLNVKEFGFNAPFAGDDVDLLIEVEFEKK